MSKYTKDEVMRLAQRCRAQARNMDSEGWYVAANVLWKAAEVLEECWTNDAGERGNDMPSYD